MVLSVIRPLCRSYRFNPPYMPAVALIRWKIYTLREMGSIRTRFTVYLPTPAAWLVVSRNSSNCHSHVTVAKCANYQTPAFSFGSTQREHTIQFPLWYRAKMKVWIHMLSFAVSSLTALAQTCPPEHFSAVIVASLDQTIPPHLIPDDPELNFF